jgi:hypothetical protein
MEAKLARIERAEAEYMENYRWTVIGNSISSTLALLTLL